MTTQQDTPFQSGGPPHPPRHPPRPPRRLAAILELLSPEATTIADIGYDHGLLIPRLLHHAPGARVIGIERLPEAAARFWQRFHHMEGAWRARVSLRLGDGLEPLALEEVDTLIIAGLGQEAIAAMLEAAPERLHKARALICASVHYPTALPAVLNRLGWRIVDERLAREGRRYTLIFRAEPRGPQLCPSPVPYYCPHLLARCDPHLHPYLCQARDRFADALLRLEVQPPEIQAYCAGLAGAIVAAKPLRG